MAGKVVNQVNSISITECAKLIDTVAEHITVVIQSEPGCGKSSILKMLEERHGSKYDYIYVDCPVLDMSDIVMRIPNHQTRTLESYVSSLFRIDSPRPKVVMLDEFMKAPKMLQIIFTRLMLERTVGDVKLPEGSLVFATSNNTSDGVGDTMLAHSVNRVMRVNMRKPDHKEWLAWATDHDISVLTRAWVAMNTPALNSYVDLNDTELKANPFIFNPANGATRAFVSPRSLAKNDINVKMKAVLGDEVTRVAMTGTIGPAAAESMHSFFLIERDLVPFEDVINNPDKVPMPTNGGALLMMLFNGVDNIETQDELTQFMKFVLRIKNAEWQSIFNTMVCQSKKTVRLAKNNKTLADWMVRNFQLYT